MKAITVTTAYSDDTRELQTTAILTGFVDGLPDKVLTGVQFDTITLSGSDKLAASDHACLMQSIARALLSVNNQAHVYSQLNANKALAGEVGSATIDPIAVFDNALNPPSAAVNPITVFDNALNPPT